MDKKQASSKRYPPESKERAVRMVGNLRHADPDDQGVISRVARQLGVGKESLRAWIKQSAVDVGHQPGVTTAERDEHLNGQQFDSLVEAKVLTEDWRIDYNRNRPHSAHSWLIPVEFVETWLHRQAHQLA